MRGVRSRWAAFAIHLAISLVIFLGLAAVILVWWFPGALFSAAGGWDGIQIVALVDLVLGPSLTLIVYNVAKPARELVRDLSIIATVQFVCLVAGVYTVFHARPLVVVHVFDTFYTFNREGYSQIGVESSELERLSGFTPKIVYVEVPQEAMEFLSQHAKALLNDEKPLQQRVDLYREMPSDPKEVKALLHGAVDHEKDDCINLDIETPYKAGTVCFNPKSAKFIDFVPQ